MEMEDNEKTDPGQGTFSIVSGIFNEKIVKVRDVSGFLAELGPTQDRAEAMWRLANALREMLDIGEDLHRMVKLMAAEGQAEVEITIDEP